MQFRTYRTAGFTLTELAIVLVIVALLVGGMMVSLTASRDIANEKETQKQLASINEALLGFAVAQRRLPCPAAPNSTGVESPAGGVCTDSFNGFLPGIALGLTPTDAQGYVLDAWGNRIRYAVSGAHGNAFTTANGMQNQWGIGLAPDLSICNSATGITGGNCGAGNELTTTAVAVIFSTGRNGAAAPTSPDELANWTTSNDRVFVSMTPTPNFDDIVLWLSPNILYNRLIAAGRLP